MEVSLYFPETLIEARSKAKDAPFISELFNNHSIKKRKKKKYKSYRLT